MESEEKRGDRLESINDVLSRRGVDEHTHAHRAISAEQRESTLTWNSCFSMFVIQTVFVNVTHCLLKFDSKKKKEPHSNL